MRKAFAVARSAHDGQLRRSGEPVLAHALATALLLAEMGLDEQCVAAGLLHDTLDDTPLTSEQLESAFPHCDVPSLVRGVSQISLASQLLRDTLPGDSCDGDHECEEGMRAMLLAMADVRVVLVKLADRAHNLRTISALSPASAARVARETLSIFVPLAARLGVWSLKAEMEDACFRTLQPDQADKLASALLAQGSHEVAASISALSAALSASLGQAGVRVLELAGRPKNLFSTWSKMQRKKLDVDMDVSAILDARGLRVICADEEGCYQALRSVHSLWTPEPGRMKDYIRSPKSNGYRSLHTVVRDGEGRAVEVQIRTSEMHSDSEQGVAAHWRYKRGSGAGWTDGAEAGAGGAAAAWGEEEEEGSLFLERQVSWARFLLSWDSASCKAAGCTFPVHIPGECPHAADHAASEAHAHHHHAAAPAERGAAPPSPRAAPLYVMLRDATRSRSAARALRFLSLPRGATRRDLVRALGAAAQKQLASPGVHLLVNATLTDLAGCDPDEPLGLVTGDLLELVGGFAATPRATSGLSGRFFSMAREAAEATEALERRRLAFA